MMNNIQKSSLTYELASQNDAPELANLFHEFYPHLGWTERYLRWQYYENPIGSALVWVAKSAGKIIATYAAIPHQVYVNGTVCAGWRIQDVITRPESRGLGIYHQLSKIATEYFSNQKFSLCFTFPKEKTTSHNGFLRSGWENVFRIPLNVSTSGTLMRVQKIRAQVSPISSFEDNVDLIWKSYINRLNVSIWRSAHYLNWRYLTNPKVKYFPFRLTLDDDELILILKYYDREDGTRWAHVCDLFQTGNNPDLTESAVQHWIHFALDFGCHSLSCWCPNGSMLSLALDRYQFTQDIDQFWWVVIKTNSIPIESKHFSDEKRWHLSMGDSDVF